MCETLTKTCTKCGDTKPLDEFHRDMKRGDLGVVARCKPCVREYQKHYRQKSESKEREKAYKASPESKEREKAYKASPEYREKENARRRKAYAENPEYREKLLSASRTLEHKVSKNARRRKAYAENPEYREKLLHSQRGENASRARKHRLLISDVYVRSLISEQSGITRSNIPSELVELKRKHLQVHRYIKENLK